MNALHILVVVLLVLVVVGLFPFHPFGYLPSGGLGVLLLVLIIVLLLR